ncbi:MAG TPA: GNAT family N-acetyltransferase [Acidimicrobiia bacterium]|nr:GNAT family N-acetyltransferase [Acidimicrobiia bacterium]
MSYEISEVDYHDLSDEQFQEVVDVANALDAEAFPRHVENTAEEMRIYTESPGMTHHRFLAHDGGQLVALANFRYPNDGTNAETLLCHIRVLPDHRRQGIATELLTRGVELASQLERKTLQGVISDTVPAGKAFVSAIGARETLHFHENVVRIDDLDLQLLQRWVDQGPERAPGYSIRLIDGLWPEEFLDDIAHLFFVLERDMPTSEVWEPREWNAERVSELQDHYAKSVDSLSTLAIEDSTGRVVGMSDMIRRKTDPTTWMVTTTMVDPEHRGKSLGKWVKGAINLAALERWDGGIYQETGNAFINEPMLAINRAMGFEHELTMTDCLLDIEDARSYLETRK